MNAFEIQDAWLKACRLLGMTGDKWFEAFDSVDVVTLARVTDRLEHDGMLDSLRDWKASSGRWCVRDSNLAGQCGTDTSIAEGPASFVIWRRGNDVLFQMINGKQKQDMIARRMHTAADIAEFFATRGKEPPGLLQAWIACIMPVALVQSQTIDESSSQLSEMKRAAIIERLGRRYPALESALNRGEEWTKACRVPDRHGWYYFERIEVECHSRYGGTAPQHSPPPAASLKAAAQLLNLSR